MHTEMQKLGAEKNSADKNAHYNVCMVLKIKQQDAIVLLLQARREYRLLRGKKARGLFLDRLSEETGYDRKHLIKLLNSKKRKTVQKRGAPIKLTGEDVDLVRHIWALSHYTNAEYLQQNIHRWLTDYSSTLEEPLSEKQIKRISSVSYKTLERALKAYRCKEQPVRNWLRSATIQEGIELVESIRKVDGPGYICMDTVAHGGRSTSGSFVWTLTWTDIYTGFTLNRAVWNKGFEGMKEAFDYCVMHTPFKVISINVDNGGEFLNYHAIRYWRDKRGIKLTHSRPHMKNDNAHAEQKNRTHVRELFARFRLDEYRFVEEMNKIYELNNIRRNYMIPCKVLRGRVLNPTTGRYKRVYDKVRTPIERILDCECVEEGEKEDIRAKMKRINFSHISQLLQKALNVIFEKIRYDNPLDDELPVE